MRPLEQMGNLKAFADMRIGDIIIRNCAVFEGKRGTFATLPRQVSKDGRWSDVVIVADDDLKNKCQEELLHAYEAEVCHRQTH